MNLSGDARTLWDAAVALDRAAPTVSPAQAPGRTLPPMLFLTDPARTAEPWRTAQTLPAGAGVVYRAFGASDAVVVARRLRAITADRGVRLLIGLDATLAESIGADGVHLPERAFALATTLRSAHPDWLLTGAVHSQDAANAAPADLDALILSPVFPAGGVSAEKPVLGVEAFAAVVRTTRHPIYALGGISADTVERLVGTGACGFAAVDAIQRAFADL
ncbi:thiamine phosphate synthase [soil metagenome]